VDFINHRPRKSLDYRTPYEVFFASSEPVAFQVWIGGLIEVLNISPILLINNNAIKFVVCQLC
jgi:hypothetical protein